MRYTWSQPIVMAKLSDLLTAQLLPRVRHASDDLYEEGTSKCKWEKPNYFTKFTAISFKCLLFPLRAVQRGEMTGCLLRDFGKQNLREQDDRVSTIVVSGIASRRIGKKVSHLMICRKLPNQPVFHYLNNYSCLQMGSEVSLIRNFVFLLPWQQFWCPILTQSLVKSC